MPALSPPSGLEERDCRGFMTLENKVDRQGEAHCFVNCVYIYAFL